MRPLQHPFERLLAGRAARAGLSGVLGLVLTGAAVLATAAPASAHVVPSTVVELDVHADDVTAELVLPATDLATATKSEGVDLSALADGAAVSPQEAAHLAEQVESYLEEHIAASSAAGTWTVDVGDVASTTTAQYGTGDFPAVTATAVLTPPAGAADADLRSFVLHDDAIVHQVVTADTYVVLRSDWAAGEIESPRTIGTITVDTVTGTIAPLTVDLGEGSAWRGFTGMVRLGISHIAEGTDHQLFLLTLLLPAPLVAGFAGLTSGVAGAGAASRRRRWTGVSTAGGATRRITAITLAFTVGHSVTLALGTLGLPVPQQPVEALIAVSILVAAAHAVRPLFPGREPLVAGLFGLVHGMAFSATLSALDLSGGQLALSLLGFNLGIEIMQLAVVLVVLPPLVVLASTRGYRPLRVAAALLTGVAALGWLLDRVGVATPLAAAADSLGALSPWVAGALWVAAITVLVRRSAGTGDREVATRGSTERLAPVP